MNEPAKPYTNASFALDVATLASLLQGDMSRLAQGMWNPDFCAADATEYARIFVTEVRERLANIERRAALEQSQ